MSCLHEEEFRADDKMNCDVSKVCRKSESSVVAATFPCTCIYITCVPLSHAGQGPTQRLTDKEERAIAAEHERAQKKQAQAAAKDAKTGGKVSCHLCSMRVLMCACVCAGVCLMCAHLCVCGVCVRVQGCVGFGGNVYLFWQHTQVAASGGEVGIIVH